MNLIKRNRQGDRVILVTRTFVPDSGAAPSRLHIAASALSSMFSNVDIITSKSPYGTETGLPPNVSISRWPVLRDHDGSVRGYLQYLSFDIPAFFRLLCTPRSSVVLCEPPPTTGFVVRIACALKRTPYVYYACDILSDAVRAQGTHPLIAKAVSALERFSLSGASAILAVSPYTQKRVKELSGKSAEIVTFAVDMERTIPVREPPSDFPQSGPVFVYAGTVAKWMGTELFVDASDYLFQEFPEAHVIFIGQGSGWDSLVAAVARKNDARIICKNSLPAEEANAWLTHATASLASILPGSPYKDAYTTKILTSLAVGTPIVYAGIGPAAEDIMDNKLGLVALATPDEIGHAMSELVRKTTEQSTDYDPIRLRTWVQKNHSLNGSKSAILRTFQKYTTNNN